MASPCYGEMDLFFSDDPADQAVAQDLCLDCPVMIACRDGARKRFELYGVWGGETARQRAKLLTRSTPRRDRPVRTAQPHQWREADLQAAFELAAEGFTFRQIADAMGGVSLVAVKMAVTRYRRRNHRVAGTRVRARVLADSDARRAEVLALAASGTSPADIAATVGVSRPWVNRILRSHGVGRRGVYRRDLMERDARIYSLHASGALTKTAIAERFGLSFGGVLKAIDRYAAHRGQPAPARAGINPPWTPEEDEVVADTSLSCRQAAALLPGRSEGAVDLRRRKLAARPAWEVTA